MSSSSRLFATEAMLPMVVVASEDGIEMGDADWKMSRARLHLLKFLGAGKSCGLGVND